MSTHHKYALLYHPRTYHEANYRYYYIPYSIVSIAAALGPDIACVLIDNNVARHDDPAAFDLPEPSEWAFVGVSAMIGQQITDGLRFVRHIKAMNPHCPVVWGGACPTMLGEQLLREAVDVDVAVLGQGEVTIRDLWRALSQGLPLTAIAGLAFRQDGHLIKTGQRSLVDLNSLPPYRPLYDAIHVDRYVRRDEHIAPRTVNYHSSQGCAYRCGFCSEPVLWNFSWRAMSAPRIVDDLEPLVADYAVSGIKFYDSEFFIQRERVLQFARLLLDRGLELQWAASAHPRNFLKLEPAELALLKQSGLSRVLLGAETGVQEELALVKKDLTPAMVREAGRRCANVGISASFTFVTGYPGAPLENIDRTLSFAAELAAASARHEAKVHFYAPYPGTSLYEMACAHGFEPPATLSDWSRYDYYYIQTPWIPGEYLEKVRTFNEVHYPYLMASEMS